MTRMFTNKNWEIFINQLTLETWHDTYAQAELDKKSEAFMEKLIYYFELSFSLKKINYKSQPN